jgi:molybdopterin-containing oxidoreductase family iron-sulfur binding subunit
MSSLGKDYWRSLEERASSPEFERWLRGEFPAAADLTGDELGRRDFLRLMGASMALAGLGACTKQPIEKIVPYVKQPENVVPGKPLHFATATTFVGYAQGVIVRSNEGRPTKIEGNPDHPASLGATSIWGQADLLDLYDPDRAQAITKRGEVSTWNDFLGELTQLLQEHGKTGGAGLRILTRTITSPTLLGQIAALLKKLPGARWCQWDPLPANVSESEDVVYNFADATTIVALDSDFLSIHPAALRHVRDFASARRITDPGETNMSRFYVAEPTPTITGSNADHRVAIESREIAKIAQALATLVSGGPGDASLPGPIGKWVAAAAADLLENRGAGVVIAGETQPGAVHKLVQEINDTLGNLGTTISPRPAITVRSADPAASLRALVAEMNSGAVKLLLILDGDPVYDAPVDLEFEKALAGVETTVHHSLFVNQTSKRSHWHLPAAHFLESWSDALAFDGTATIIQPLIEPLYDGRTAHEVLEGFVQQPVRSAYEIIHQSWAQRTPRPDFEAKWNDAVQRGVAPEPKRVGNNSAREREANSSPNKVDDQRSPLQGLEILFRADPNVLDGRYANNGWIQELPRPFSKLTWDNAALVSPGLADELRLSSGDVVELEFRGRKIFAPIWIQPGQARNSVTIHLGYGRSEIGRVGKGVGFNAYALRTSDAMWSGDGLTIRKTAQSSYKFAATQLHHSIEGRHMFRAGTLAQFQNDPEFAPVTPGAW